jgi:hypothetical protein
MTFPSTLIENTDKSSPKADKKTLLSAQSRPYRDTEGGALIYQSKQGEGIHLNFKGKDKYNRPVVCRHLAGLVASKGMKDYAHILSSVRALEREPYLASNIFDSRDAKISRYIAFSSIPSFGQTLQETAQQVALNRESTFILGSENHRMTLTIRHKELNNDESHYIIKFYDPNKSDIHLRAICPNLKTIDSLSLSDFLKTEEINRYFPKLQCFYMESYEKCQDNTPPIIYTSPDGADDAYLFYSLHRGDADNVKRLINNILSDKTLTEDEQLKRLQPTASDGTFGLAVAFQFGHLKAILSYVNTILHSNLTNEQCFKLLQSKNHQGVPVLAIAFLKDYDHILKPFISTILSSRLSYQQKFSLVQSNIENQGPAFYATLQVGHEKTIRMYMDIILNTEFTSDEKLHLLEAKILKGDKGLFVALTMGYTNIVNIYMDNILHAGFSHRQLFQLLQAQNQDNYSGLYAALRLGHIETAKAYIANVLEARLNPIEIHTLCTKEWHNDIPNETERYTQGFDVGFFKTPKDKSIEHYMARLFTTLEETRQDITLSSASSRNA